MINQEETKFIEEQIFNRNVKCDKLNFMKKWIYRFSFLFEIEILVRPYKRYTSFEQIKPLNGNIINAKIDNIEPALYRKLTDDELLCHFKMYVGDDEFDKIIDVLTNVLRKPRTKESFRAKDLKYLLKTNLHDIVYKEYEERIKRFRIIRNNSETYIKHRRKYKRVMNQLLKKYHKMPEIDVCPFCGIFSIEDSGYNICGGCGKGVCVKCDDNIVLKKYNSWYNGDYGFIFCPSCYSDWKIMIRNKKNKNI